LSPGTTAAIAALYGLVAICALALTGSNMLKNELSARAVRWSAQTVAAS
jgi:hypothetical protein